MNKICLLITKPPHSDDGQERMCGLAKRAREREMEVTVYLIGDGVFCAKKGQKGHMGESIRMALENGIRVRASAKDLVARALPEEQVEGLKKLGDWMAINKEALYATIPAPFDRSGTFRSEYGSIRFTRKKEYLFAIDLEKPTVPYVIPNVIPLEGSEIKMLGSDKSLGWHLEESEEDYDDEYGQNLVIEELPDPLPCDYAWSFKIQVLDKSW